MLRLLALGSSRANSDNKRFAFRTLNYLRSLWEKLRESFWFVPLMMAAGSSLLASWTVRADAQLSEEWARKLGFMGVSTAEGSRAVLSAISASMITVTGVVFSTTIVVLALTSSQFGPRLLRTFLRDRSNQFVLGIFISTYLYALLVLRAVEISHLPMVGTLGAVVLAVMSTVVLIYFIHHAAYSVQASTIIESLAVEIDKNLEELFTENLGDDAGEFAGRPDALHLNKEAVVKAAVHCRRQGYIRLIDMHSMLILAEEHQVFIDIRRKAGDFVHVGMPVATVKVVADGQQEISESLLKSIAGCFVVGHIRTPVQDLLFLTKQMTEMAVRSLSPGINDPQTAISCIHRLGAVVAKLSQRKMSPLTRCDKEGVARIFMHSLTFDQIIKGCFDSIVYYGAKDPAVIISVIHALANAGSVCKSASRRSCLRRYLEEISVAYQKITPVLERNGLELQREYQKARSLLS